MDLPIIPFINQQMAAVIPDLFNARVGGHKQGAIRCRNDFSQAMGVQLQFFGEILQHIAVVPAESIGARKPDHPTLVLANVMNLAAVQTIVFIEPLQWYMLRTKSVVLTVVHAGFTSRLLNRIACLTVGLGVDCCYCFGEDVVTSRWSCAEKSLYGQAGCQSHGGYCILKY